MSAVENWSRVAAQNNATPPDGAPEGWGPETVNAWAREIMRAIREFYEDPEFLNLVALQTVSKASASQVLIAGIDATAKYPANRRIQLQGGGNVFGFVNAVSYSAPDTTVTVSLDGGAVVPNGTNKILAHVFKTASSTAFAAADLDIATIRLQF